MNCVESNGGPLIALPVEHANLWHGAEASPGTNVPPGWEWSGNDDDPVRTDYDRACGKLRVTHVGSYGGVGLLEVGDGDALVFRRYRVMACDYTPSGAGDYELYAYRLVWV